MDTTSVRLVCFALVKCKSIKPNNINKIDYIDPYEAGNIQRNNTQQRYICAGNSWAILYIVFLVRYRYWIIYVPNGTM